MGRMDEHPRFYIFAELDMVLYYDKSSKVSSTSANKESTAHMGLVFWENLMVVISIEITICNQTPSMVVTVFVVSVAGKKVTIVV